jgi:hypothetical protein
MAIRGGRRNTTSHRASLNSTPHRASASEEQILPAVFQAATPSADFDYSRQAIAINSRPVTSRAPRQASHNASCVFTERVNKSAYHLQSSIARGYPRYLRTKKHNPHKLMTPMWLLENAVLCCELFTKSYHSNVGAVLLRVCVDMGMLLHSNEHSQTSTVADRLAMFATCGRIPWKAPTVHLMMEHIRDANHDGPSYNTLCAGNTQFESQSGHRLP